jgi:hypothetical protein
LLANRGVISVLLGWVVFALLHWSLVPRLDRMDPGELPVSIALGVLLLCRRCSARRWRRGRLAGSGTGEAGLCLSLKTPTSRLFAMECVGHKKHRRHKEGVILSLVRLVPLVTIEGEWRYPDG